MPAFAAQASLNEANIRGNGRGWSRSIARPDLHPEAPYARGFGHAEKSSCSAGEKPASVPFFCCVCLGNDASCDRTDGLHDRRRRYRSRREEERRRGRGAARLEGLRLSGQFDRTPGRRTGPRRRLSRLGALYLLPKRLRTEIALLCASLDLKQPRQINCASGRTCRLRRQGVH